MRSKIFVSFIGLFLSQPSFAMCFSRMDPVVILHGLYQDKNSPVVTRVRDVLVANGIVDPSKVIIPHIPYSTNPFIGLAQISANVGNSIRTTLNTTGATCVDFIGHSAGGNVARYIQKTMLYSRVGTVFTISTPNHGNPWAWLLFGWFQAGRDLMPGSPFLNTLNSQDETPGYGATRFVTIRGTEDSWISLSSSSLSTDWAASGYHARGMGYGYNRQDRGDHFSVAQSWTTKDTLLRLRRDW